jgi:hypothetical protein
MISSIPDLRAQLRPAIEDRPDLDFLGRRQTNGHAGIAEIAVARLEIPASAHTAYRNLSFYRVTPDYPANTALHPLTEWPVPPRNLEFLAGQLARVPTRGDLAKAALGIILRFCPLPSGYGPRHQVAP